ncbi:MAG: hypothetical protein EZS28_015210 [Streblomastix strix]|uniref:Uncharacterized protein n=1 Tax=Streblomastix strix TaxID=222440 RepID=A0A5J4W397_9EUKA|nr:MAG: hypothetical protein EZS28_015210 [Streblomastix strix]
MRLSISEFDRQPSSKLRQKEKFVDNISNISALQKAAITVRQVLQTIIQREVCNSEMYKFAICNARFKDKDDKEGYRKQFSFRNMKIELGQLLQNRQV